MAEATTEAELPNTSSTMKKVPRDDGLPFAHPSILKDKRVILVRDLDVETVLVGLKPFLLEHFCTVNAMDAETNRGIKTGMLIDFLQRFSVQEYDKFNMFLKIIGGTQPDLFFELVGRVPSEEEADFCVQRCVDAVKDCIQSHSHDTDSPLDQRIDLDCEHVQLTIVTADSETPDALRSEQLGTASAAATASRETSDDLHPFYLSRCADREDNVPATEVLTSVTGEEKPRKVLLTGRSGTGKSTTMQWLAREWSFNRWATDFTLVFFLQLRMLSLFDCQMTVIELLLLHSLYAATKVTEVDLVCLVSSWLKTSGAKILIFVDGLDEVSGFTDRCQKIFKFTDKAHPIDLCLNILHGNLLPMATVVSASRPFSGLTGTIHFQRHFEIIGLSESQVIEYVQRKHPSKAVSITSVLKGSPLIMSVCNITFYCALISSLMADGVIFKSDDLQTYTRLISFVIVQHVSRKLTQWSFLIEVHPYFHKLSSMAYRGIFGRHLDRKLTKLVFNQYDIVEAQLNSQELSSLQSTGLLQTKTLKACLGHDTFVEFFHFSIQELLASAYLLLHEPSYAWNLEQLFSRGQFDMALIYLFGLRFDTGSRWLKEVRLAVNSSSTGGSVYDHYLCELMNELCEKSKKESQFTSKLRLCQLLHEGQLDEKAKTFANNIAPNGALTIKNTPLTIIDLMAVRFVCKHADAIEEICLTKCSANSTLVDFLASSIMKDHETTLHTLRITENKLENAGAASIARLLQEDNQLQILDVQGNDIGDNGAADIAAALPTTLQTLFIGGNNISEIGAAALAVALQNNSTLLGLDVGGNTIGDNGATALALALHQNNTLRALDVSDNKIGDEGFRALNKIQRVGLKITTGQRGSIQTFFYDLFKTAADNV